MLINKSGNAVPEKRQIISTAKADFKKGGGKMYFMNICTWEPKDEKEVKERRKKWKWPDKIQVIFEFLDLQGCRVINVINTDERGLIASRSDWVDILAFETFPVYPIGDTKKKLP